MWKTHLIYCKHLLYISTGSVDNLWITLLPVDNFGNKVSSPLFPQAKNRATCGNVEKTCLIVAYKGNVKIDYLNNLWKTSINSILKFVLTNCKDCL